MNPAYIPTVAVLAGLTIGGLTSCVTLWLTQRTPLRRAHREVERAALKALYSDFITEAARLFGDALARQTEEITGLVGLYAMVGRMRLIADETVIITAAQVEAAIINTYLEPNRTLSELSEYASEGGMNILAEFCEACRKDLAARVMAAR